MKYLYSIASILAVLLLCACAKPSKVFEKIDEETLISEQGHQFVSYTENWIKNYKYISEIGGGFLFGSTQICDQKHQLYDIGLKVSNMYSAPENIRVPLSEILNLDDYLKVIVVEKNSPSKKAGIQEGDVILKIDQYELHGEYAQSEYESAIDKDIKKTYMITLLRNENIIDIKVESRLKCFYDIKLNFDNQTFNAWVDEKNNITFSLRLAEWLYKQDLATAIIISHEMAHIYLNHIEIKKKNSMLAGIFGLALDIGAYTAGINTGGRISAYTKGLGSKVYSKQIEKEADYIGIYILAINNYNYKKAPNFWRKFAIEVPDSIYSSTWSTHPSTSERYTLLKSAVREIDEKKINNEDLVQTLIK